MSSIICGECARGDHPHKANTCKNMWLDSSCGCISFEGYTIAPSIDANHLARQKAWSEKTFGPGERTHGVIAHIKKELDEIEADPSDIMEWVDVLILAFDGAWRVGWEPQEIIDAIKLKQQLNEQREWPDWRQFTNGEAIEHIKVAK